MPINIDQLPKMHLARLGVFLTLALAFSACRTPLRHVSPSTSVAATHIASQTRTPTASPSPTHTATRTPTVTPTRTPRRTPTVTLTLIPKPTRTATPSPTNTRWVATSIPMVWETPTPLPTPASGAIDYLLKAWDAGAALGLVETVEQYAFANNIPAVPGQLLLNYQRDQAVVRLAVQEALHRFPGGSYRAKLEWRIARANTIQDSRASDAWILLQMEGWLNDGKVTPENLDRLLNPYGFQISQRESAPNLFGDGRTAQVIWITLLESGNTGLYAALCQDDRGRYTLTRIDSGWSFIWGATHTYTIADHTGDGVPEVIFERSYRNGSTCWNYVLIYQWENDQFIDISQGGFTLECDDPPDWKYGAPDENGSEPIETWDKIDHYLMLYRYRRYEWNGTVYELSKSWFVPPEKYNDTAAQWVVNAMNEGDYASVIDKVPQYLSAASQREAAAADFGPSYLDYLRFQLGLAYAFQSDSVQARAAFEQIVQEPENPLTTTVPQAAQAYLDNFSGEADFYRACQAALKVMEKASGAHPFGLDTVDYTHLRQAWGYEPDWEWDSIALCSLNTAFQRTAAQLDGRQFAAAPSLLTQAGVSIRASVEVDLNQDGQNEWVLLVNTPGDDVPVNLWVLLKSDQGVVPTPGAGTTHGVVALPVVTWNLKPYNLPLENAYAAGLSVKTVVSPEGTTIVFIRSGEFLYTIRLDAVKPAINWILWPQGAVVSYYIYPQGGGLELEITTNTYYCKYCTDYYHWENQDFQSYDPQEEQASQAEAALLVDWNPDKAIPLLQTATQDTSYAGRPRLLYVLGLAYELSGDRANAVQTYWKLWSEVPESSYARLARAKLEPFPFSLPPTETWEASRTLTRTPAPTAQCPRWIRSWRPRSRSIQPQKGRR